MENLENLEKINKTLENKNLEKSEKEKLEKEKASLIEKINADLNTSEKGLFWYNYTDKNKTLHFNKDAMENLEKLGYKLSEKDAKNKYISYVKNSVKFNTLEKIFIMEKDLFSIKATLEKEN